MSKMPCPECQQQHTKVISSRLKVKRTFRRRECPKCGARFSTIEILVPNSLLSFTREGELARLIAEQESEMVADTKGQIRKGGKVSVNATKSLDTNDQFGHPFYDTYLND